MKHAKTFLLAVMTSVMLLVFMISAFWVGNAYAAAGCFPDTDGHWAEPFICWMKENGIAAGYADGTYRPNNGVTRAEAAVFLNKQAEIPPSSGSYQVVVGPTGWQRNGPLTDGDLYYFTNVLRMNNTAPGIIGIQTSPTLPSMIFGRIPEITGVKICSSGTASQYIEYSVLSIFQVTDSGTFNVATAVDTTNHQSTGCYTLTLDTPVLLAATLSWKALNQDSQKAKRRNLTGDLLSYPCPKQAA
jgi:hypothetical protein